MNFPKTNFDEKLINRLAKLSKLEFTDEEKPKVIENLAKIANFIDQINGIKTDEISNDECFNQAHTPLRDDVVLRSDVSASILENAPKSQDGFFIVPKIIE
ncbi:MAG: Asp-tRNA(Asn)/Glu-tRNA(Gln) amidotransferase subunit GatC [Helicobacter sp.]|nr:Asp-tRNA(Asn)/Glu-tRNA(Gln) amidotransferase subunit GatC [Helicobacter sp.]